jgi:hypothetical protein
VIRHGLAEDSEFDIEKLLNGSVCRTAARKYFSANPLKPLDKYAGKWYNERKVQNTDGLSGVS